MFDIFPDGTRLAMAPVIQPEDSSRRDHVTFIFNFFEELRRAASK
jgi:CCR4-NOT transcriptional regulation complex NOT5 subunit